MKNEAFNFVGAKKQLASKKKKINVDLSFAMSPNPHYSEEKD